MKMKQAKNKHAVGAIGILISLFIISVVFVLMIPMIRTLGGGVGLNTSIKTKSIEKQVDEQVNAIMKMRQRQQSNSNIYNQEN